MGKSGNLPLVAAVTIFIGVWPAFASGQLTLTLPPVTMEGVGTIDGVAEIDTAAPSNLVVNLVSDRPSEVGHGSVTIPAGTNRASFNLHVVDDQLLDGVQTATLTAQADGYADASASVFIQDNEQMALFLDLPQDLFEGQGTATGAGTVSLGGIAVSDHRILLQSSDTTVASVQQTVTVKAGKSNAVFSISVGDDAVADGRQYTTVTASVPGFTPASASLGIGDNELEAFAVSFTSQEMPADVPLLTTVSALNIDGEPIPSYSGSLQLSAKSPSRSSISVEPSTSGTFVDGRWQGGVTVPGGADSGVQLLVSDGAGHSGTSSAFDLFELRAKKMVTDWSLPYVYIMHRDPNPSYPDIYDYPPARFIWFNTDFEAVEQVVDPGENALDITVHYGENRIYLSRQSEAVVYDRTTKQVLAPLPVTSSASQVAAGRAGRLVTGRGRYADLWDTTTGTRLAYVYAREGGGKCSPDGRYYFYAEDGNTGTKLSKYDITGDTFVKGVSVDTRNFGSENLVLSGDGSLAFNVGSVFQTSDLDEVAFNGYDKEVYSASFHGEYAATETDVIKSLTGEVLLRLPAWRSEQSAFYPDQSSLLVFDPYTAGLHMVPLDTLGGGLPEPGMLPEPAVGSLCMTSLPELSWTPMPDGIAYDVFLGSDSNAVANATTNSAEYLGRDAVSGHALAGGTLNGNETYYWRVDIIKYGGEMEKGTVWNFKTASIRVDQADLFAEGIAAAYAKPVSIPVDHTVATPAAWSVSCSSEWVVLGATNGVAPDSLDLAVDFATLAAGNHTTELVFNDGSGTFVVPFTVSVEQLRIVKMATDYELPYIYMLHTSGTSPNPSTLFWYNTATGGFDHVLAAGENGTDLTVHHADDRIYVSNGGRDETRVFDRTAKVELDPLPLGNDAYKVSAGATGRLVAEGYANYGGSVNAHVFSTGNGTSLATTSFASGDGECSPDGRFYYHGQSKLITKYDLGLDTFSVVTNKTIPNSWNVVVSRDGTRVSTSRSVFDADLNELFYLDNSIHALSAHGGLIVTYNKLFNGGTGGEIQYLPFNTSVMAFSGDQSQLLLFNSTSGSLTSLATSAIMPVPDAALDPVPAVGSVHGANLPSLSWTGSPSAVGYDVYLGTDAAAVATNGTGSAEYLGRFTETGLALPEGTLSGNQTYFWRVDMVGFGNAIVAGNVWSFDTASIAVDPYRIEVGAVAAAYTQQVEIAIQNSVGAPVAWTVDCTNEWVQLGAPGGTGSATLDIGIDVAGLEPGIHSADVVFDDAGHQLIVPIELTVEAMRLVKMEADWTLPYVYMVHASPTYPNPSLLIWYNTDTETIEQALDAGDGATDLAVHYGENRIYVNNSVHSEIRVFDRSSKEELEPLPSNANLKSLGTGLPGTLLAAGADAYLTDTETGATLDSYPTYNGGGDSTLDGRTYYHSEKGYSGASVIKFAVLPGTSDPLDYIDQVRTKDYYGSDQILVGMDGQRVYSGGAIYDADLNELFDLNDTLYAASAFGDLVVSETKAYDGTSGSEVYSLPLSASVMAFTADQSKLLLFDEANASVTNIDTAAIMPLPAPDMVPVPADGSVQRPTIENLSWSMAPGALQYDVYLGTDSNAVSVAGTNALEYLGRFDLSNVALTNGQLSGSQSYAWRVDTVRFGDDVVQGDVWGFRTTSFAVVPNELSTVGMAAAYTQTVSLAIDSMVAGTVDWTVSCTNDWIVLAETNGTASGSLDVGVDMGRVAPGTHTANLIFSDGSDVLTVPVAVDVEAMRVVKMVTDYSKPYIYMVHTSAESPYPSRLIWYNTDTEAVEQVRDAGLNADDLTVHYADDRIYINNAGTTKQAFDRSTKEATAPLVLANSQNGISAAGAGQVVVESSGSFVRIGLRDTADGSELSYHYWVWPGDGECTRDGRFYYHVESDGSSSSDLFKFSIESNTISYVGETTTKGLGWGDYGIVVSMDGQRIYTHHLIFDAELNKLLDLGAEVHAASAYGDLVVAESAAYNGHTGDQVYSLPFSSSVMAFSGDQQLLVLFNAADGTLTALPTADMMALPVPVVQAEATTAYAAWQSAYFPDTVLAADADGDLDGQSNFEEYIAGTDPTSKDSCLVVHAVEPLPNGQVVIRWDSVDGREYSIYWTPSLTNSFNLLESEIHHPQNSYTDQVERVEQSGFYQVGVELE